MRKIRKMSIITIFYKNYDYGEQSYSENQSKKNFRFQPELWRPCGI